MLSEEETYVPGSENLSIVTRNTLSHNVVSNTPRQ